MSACLACVAFKPYSSFVSLFTLRYTCKQAGACTELRAMLKEWHTGSGRGDRSSTVRLDYSTLGRPPPCQNVDVKQEDALTKKVSPRFSWQISFAPLIGIMGLFCIKNTLSLFIQVVAVEHECPFLSHNNPSFGRESSPLHLSFWQVPRTVLYCIYTDVYYITDIDYTCTLYCV